MNIGETETEVDALVGVVERLQDVCIEAHLAVFVEGGLLEEVLGYLGHAVALGYGVGPQAYLGFLALTHLAGDVLHLPQCEERQGDGHSHEYQF